MLTSFILWAMRAVWPMWGSRFGGAFLSDEPVLCSSFPIMFQFVKVPQMWESISRHPAKKVP